MLGENFVFWENEKAKPRILVGFGLTTAPNSSTVRRFAEKTRTPTREVKIFREARLGLSTSCSRLPKKLPESSQNVAPKKPKVASLDLYRQLLKSCSNKQTNKQNKTKAKTKTKNKIRQNKTKENKIILFVSFFFYLVRCKNLKSV